MRKVSNLSIRKKIIAGNWKMNKTVPEAIALVGELVSKMDGLSGADVVICPPYTALYPVNVAREGSSIKLGAQDVFWKASGAYTSNISVAMLLDVGVEYVIIGHSETRGRFGVPEEGLTEEHLKVFGETDASVNLKAIAALSGGLYPIICIGETLSEREAGETDSIVSGQVEAALTDIAGHLVAESVVLAYEPVWAIGTGKVCAADEADRVCGVVRQTVANLYDEATAQSVRIQYGGSMKPDNAVELLSKENIDGGLIGGASLKAGDFVQIVAAAG